MHKRLLVTICMALSSFTFDCFGQGGTWTWMHGSASGNSTGSYGTKGVAAASNEPPARYQACYWTDKQGNFWLFGGVMAGGSGLGNDLWKYDVVSNMWTWVNGPNVIGAPNTAGVFGTKGVPSSNNYPSGRGYGANCWTDNAGNLWLYGGYGGYNDLWKYTISTNQWAWINGNQIVTGAVYGTKGVPASTNTPGTIQEVKSAWVDAANNLWMFGGQDGSTSNILWKYNIASDTWTWMNGMSTTTTGNYGTYRVETPTNEPPSRWSYTRWKDASDNMYLFAGSTSGTTNFNDVWRYRPSTNNWTWVSGTNLINDTGHYPPQQCKFYDTYFPSARFENQTAFSLNSCSKAFWTFGGWNRASKFFNDLWLFSTDSFKWSWVSGSNQLDAAGTYGTIGVPSASNVPPGKAGQCMWIDNQNNLWLFGGYKTGFAISNDLWRFIPDSTCIDKYSLFGGHLSAPDTVICAGDTSVLNIGAHQSLTYTPNTFVTHNADSSVLWFKPTASTAYRVTIRGGPCSAADDTLQFTIHVNPRDSVNLVPPTPLVICNGDSTRMKVDPLWNVTVSPNAGVTYQGIGGSEIIFYPNTNTTYTVTAASTSDCPMPPDTLQFTIIIDTAAAPHLLPMTDTVLCKGDTAVYQLSTKLDRYYVKPATGYSISADELTFRFYPSISTRYQFVGIKSSACRTNIDTLNFTVHQTIVKASFNLTPKVTDLHQPEFQLTNTSRNASHYAWYQNNSFWTNLPSPTLNATDTGKYCFMLVANDVYNCFDTAIDCGRIIDARIYVPSAFTPNGDGLNGIFKPITKNVKIMEFSVYNRFGERVFVSYTNDYGWDGTYHEIPCDMGTYFYQIRYKIAEQEPVLLKGDVTLLR